MKKRISNYELRIKKKILNSYSLLPTSGKSVGFTLIELIIVIAMIGGLATIFLTTYPGTQRKARDTLRKNDLRQYQTALETYANRTGNNGFYPSRTTSVQGDTTLCTNLGLTDCSSDPRDGQNECSGSQCRYFFRSNGTCGAGNACATDYFLYARLEQPLVSTTPYWFVCSNGESGEVASVPIAGITCPVP